jgi:thiol-disulfide isomerase/thioredoxin
MLRYLRTFQTFSRTARYFAPAAWLALCLGCASTSPQPAATKHGTLSELSRVEGKVTLCDHRVPEQVCTRHHPELIAKFQRAGDWCKEHGVPESQCYDCHPDLTFDPLPRLDANADIAWLSKGGEDVPALEPHAVKGKVTLFDFYADWCAACRKVDGHVYAKLASGDQSLAYRKLNVVDWDSPLAKRYVRTVPSLPFLVVFGPDGKRVTSLHGADLAALDAALARANRR